MNNSKEFNEILDRCLESVIFSNGTIEECLESYPAYAAELRPLLETVISGRHASEIQPRPEFREHARSQFFAAMNEAATRKSRTSFSRRWQSGWAVAAVSVFLLLIMGTGTIFASRNSMPDQLLYPVKRATETVHLAVTFSRLGKVELLAGLADKRVSEIVYLAENGKYSEIPSTSETMTSQLVEIASLSTGGEAFSSVAVSPALEAAPDIAAMKTAESGGATEDAAMPSENRALITPSTTQPPTWTVTEQAPPQAAEGPFTAMASTTDPEAILRQQLAEKAEINTSILRSLLETAPEGSRAAIEQAIINSEIAYNRAIESLN